MFKNYTKPALRAIFYARCAASKNGSKEVTRLDLTEGILQFFCDKNGIKEFIKSQANSKEALPLSKEAAILLDKCQGPTEIEISDLIRSIFDTPYKTHFVLGEK